MTSPVVAGIMFVQRSDLVELEVSLVLVSPRDGEGGDENGSGRTKICWKLESTAQAW